MGNFAKAITALTVLFAFSGCKTVKIKDGEVPSQYLSQAKKLEGTYRGSFNGVRGDLNISFDGNRPVVTYKNSNGTDILNNNCGSQIGLLEEVTIKSENNNPRVSSVVFDFNPGQCGLMLDGRALYLDLKEKNGVVRLAANILLENRTYNVCQWDPGAPPNVPPREICHLESRPVYLNGVFTR